jgi:deferrochelatase/peroxidase EfeB
MSADFTGVQRIVLHGSLWQAARHVVLGFPERSQPPHFLQRLVQAGYGPTPAGQPASELGRQQVSLGFSRRGLERARVPKHVLALFALKAPAFYAGPAMRAAACLGGSVGTPGAWDPAFGFTTLDAVLSLHGNDPDALDRAVRDVYRIACDCKVHTHDVPRAIRLRPPKNENQAPDALWTHFGYRDGLSRVGIKGWTPKKDLDACKPISQYEPGEFLLGHPQNSGANPWIAGPDMRVLPEAIRCFFRNGSFGVLHQIEQDVDAFEEFVRSAAEMTGLKSQEIKAKLCGRSTDGRALSAPGCNAEDDFDFSADASGEQCPFGAHVRRMNPRGAELAHAVRVRPLLRRGLPYGADARGERGLLGQFFCASIEDQYEHLVGQWADRVPLGSRDIGSARDPLFGANEPGEGIFAIPLPHGGRILLAGLGSFTRTRGLAYLFYPGEAAFQGIRESSLWRPTEEHR